MDTIAVLRRAAPVILGLLVLTVVFGELRQSHAQAPSGRVLNHGAISCTTVTPVLVVAANPGRTAIYVKHNGATNLIYIGTGTPAALSTTTGYPLLAPTAALPAGEREILGYQGDLYCVAAGGATELRYIEVTK